MGGRGQRSYSVINRLTNYKDAVIPRDKMTDYLLNPSKGNGKAVFFSSLGYSMKNFERLESDILSKLRTNKALKYETNEYGDTEYQVNMLLGIAKKRMVSTGWIIKKNEKFPRFVTAYPNNKLKPRG